MEHLQFRQRPNTRRNEAKLIAVELQHVSNAAAHLRQYRECRQFGERAHRVRQRLELIVAQLQHVSNSSTKRNMTHRT